MAIARKCGICQKNRIANSTSPGASRRPVAAVQPMSGGIAPGIAPTNSAAGDWRFIGV